MKKIVLLIAIVFSSQLLNAQVYDMLVSKTGSGAFRTISSAIARIADNKSTRTTIFVKDGIYEEKVTLAASKKNISLIGQSAEGVIITWNDYQGKDGMSGANSYTFFAEGPDFYAENITFINTAGKVGQALAIRTDGERQVFKNCRFLGFQDTYYAHKNRQYNYKCYVEGGTDFVYGDATTVFDECTINSVSGGQYISAPADTKLISTTPAGTFLHGLLFTNCNITASTGVANNSVYLGRPWQPNATSVFINCTLGSHIQKLGWSTWDNNNHLSSVFAEFQNKNTAGELVDISGRADWSKQLEASVVADYYNLDYFLKKSDVVWDPKPMTIAPARPENVVEADGLIVWSEVADAKGYLILRGDSAIGFSLTPEYNDQSTEAGVEYNYYIKTIGANGNLSEPSDKLVATDIQDLAPKEVLNGVIQDKSITFSETVSLKIFTLAGKQVASADNVEKYQFRFLPEGIYILEAQNRKGNRLSQKIVVQ